MKMFYTLDAIPDEHPELLIIEVIKQSALDKSAREGLSKEIARTFRQSPCMVISNPEFLRDIEKKLTIGREMDITWRFKLCYSLKLAQLINHHHIDFLNDRDYTKLYHEGPDDSLLSAYAREKGLDVVLLDKDNIFYNALFRIFNNDEQFFGERGNRLQRKREGIWADRVHLYPGDAASLSAGGEHLQNEFGLVDRLAKNGIKLDPFPVNYEGLEEKAIEYAKERLKCEMGDV